MTASGGLQSVPRRRFRPAGPRALRLVTFALVVTGACSSDPTTATRLKPIVIGATSFPENVIVANLYAGALQARGYQPVVRKNMGQRDVLVPALQKGGKENGVDVIPEYVGDLLEFVNKNAGEANGDLGATMAKLTARLGTLGVTVLDPSPATDQNVFVVTKATADRYKATKLSDLMPVAGRLTLGAGPECPTAASCLPGLETIYNLRFKTLLLLDTCGPRTLDALTAGTVDVGLLCSSDGAIAARDLVVLEDGKRLETVDNVVPVVRADILDDTIRATLNKVSAALTTADLILMNKRAGIDKVDPELLARNWLLEHGFTTTTTRRN